MRLMVLLLMLTSVKVFGEERFVKEGELYVLDTQNNLLWQANTKGYSFETDWNSAVTYCKKLNLGSKKWRLPSQKELEDIKTKNNGIIIDISLFKDLQASRPHWTSTINQDQRFASYWVPANSYIWHHLKKNYSYVRCVSK